MKKSVAAMIVIALCIALPVHAAAISNNGSALSAYWEFGETTGTVASDGSGNGNDLTLYNTGDGNPAWNFAFDTQTAADRLGNSSGALYFRGAHDEVGGDFAYIEDPADLDITDGITITAWVNLPAIAIDWSTLVCKEEVIEPGDGNGYTLMVTGNGGTVNTMASWCANNTGAWTGTYSATGVDDDLGTGTWQFIAMVADGTNLQAYVNGVPDGDPVAMSPAPTSTAGKNLCVGASYIFERWFTGSVDEIAIWDGAMDAAAIADVYANGVTVSETPTPTPGDANRDGYVDVTDLGILATNYGAGGSFSWDDADFTNDGFVDVNDLGILATNYGTEPNPQAVPEPCTVALLVSLICSTLMVFR